MCVCLRVCHNVTLSYHFTHRLTENRVSEADVAASRLGMSSLASRPQNNVDNRKKNLEILVFKLRLRLYLIILLVFKCIFHRK